MIGILFICVLLSWVMFLSFDGYVYIVDLLKWIELGLFEIFWVIWIDCLMLIMLIVVNLVLLFVYLYLFGYMVYDENFFDINYKVCFFVYLLFFIFVMLMLVILDNFV